MAAQSYFLNALFPLLALLLQVSKMLITTKIADYILDKGMKVPFIGWVEQYPGTLKNHNKIMKLTGHLFACCCFVSRTVTQLFRLSDA
jgi:hypothetical protein